MKQKDFNIKKYFDLMTSCIQLGSDSHDNKITKTKLAKLMYLCDFAFYAQTGRSISNAQYLKLERGPVPLEYFSCLDTLRDVKKITVEKKGKAEMLTLVKNDEQICLSADERKLVKKVCDKWRESSTAEIVKFTHNQIPWAISFDGQNVPYSLIIQEEHVY